MVTSARWSPHVGPKTGFWNRTRWSVGPPLSVICSHVAPFAVWHSALWRRGYPPRGVGGGGAGPPIAPIGPGNRFVRRYVSSAPKPPPGATGLTHSTSRPAASPVRALRPPP